MTAPSLPRSPVAEPHQNHPRSPAVEVHLPVFLLGSMELFLPHNPIVWAQRRCIIIILANRGILLGSQKLKHWLQLLRDLIALLGVEPRTQANRHLILNNPQFDRFLTNSWKGHPFLGSKQTIQNTTKRYYARENQGLELGFVPQQRRATIFSRAGQLHWNIKRRCKFKFYRGTLFINCVGVT